MKSKGLLILIASLLMVLILAALPFATACAPKEVPTWRMATSAEGSIGHICAMALARVADQYVTDVKLSVFPTKGSTASLRTFGTGEVEACYPSSINMVDAYNKTGDFAPPNDLKWAPYHTWALINSGMLGLTLKKRNDINCLRDFAGKKVFAMGSGSSVNTLWRMALTKLGIWDKVDVREMSNMDAADALNLGTIDAIGGYSAPTGYFTVGWLINVDTRCKLKVIVPTDEEQELIASIPGIGGEWMGHPEGMVNETPDKLWVFPAYWLFEFGPDCDADLMYELVKCWDEHAQEILDIAGTGYASAAAGGLDFQSSVIEALPGIPVHPGMAKYLKEKDVWKDTWTIGEYKKRP